MTLATKSSFQTVAVFYPTLQLIVRTGALEMPSSEQDLMDSMYKSFKQAEALQR